ncbi:hypothetical protein QQF64_028832 [Cirrhinus molitorella]|uniref:Uncharacterized protein n=2 Tax=Cirrhinus molitorella TaxID=172907 RepID=A0ABR3N7S1_9TELE|nr:hypothetical protein Q8A67_014470 [Cirrhinus molitorella]
MGKHSIKRQPPSQEEDWEKELEEISQCNEKQKQPTYDPGDDLITEAGDMSRNVQNGPSSNQGHYSPAIHHIKPVKWVRFVYAVVDDQFADAEE